MTKPSTAKKLSDQSRELNSAFWEHRGRRVLELFLYRQTIGDSHSKLESPQFLANYADSHAFDAFFLLASGHDEARQEASQVIQAAQEALRLEIYPPIFIESIRNTSPFREVEMALGRAQTLTALHYGLWFSTGERPLELLRQAAQCKLDAYHIKKNGLYVGLESVMWNLVEAELFGEALALFREEHKGPTETPRDTRFSRSTVRTLAVIAEYASGNAELREVAQKAVESWYHNSSKWYVFRPFYSWSERLSWAWLRGRHFTGITELKPLLEELRGC